MATPDVIENCNSASLNSQVSAVSCALDQLNKKFGSGSLKILQDGYVDITMGSLTDNYSSPWTVECWFYPTAVGSADGWLFNQDDNTDGSLAWYVRLKASSITLGIRGLPEISAVIIAYNEWHHLRVTHAGDKLLKLYLDGALLGSKTFATETDPRIRFGKPYTFTTDEKNRWYTGNIDEIAFTVLDSSNVAEYSGDTAPVPTEGYPDEVLSPGVVIDGLFLSTSKPTANQKGLLINNKFFIPFAKSSGSGGDTSAFESDAMAIIGTPTGGGSGGESGDEIITLVSESGSGTNTVTIVATGSVIVTNGSASQTYTEFPAEFTLSAGTTTIQGAVTALTANEADLTALDISSNSVITHLLCHDNNLTTLDVTNNTALQQLGCNNNNLTSLDVTNNTALLYLGLSGNSLTTLDISSNTLLANLNVSNNDLTSSAINAILSALAASEVTDGYVFLQNQLSGGAPMGQGLTDIETIQSRGWTVTTA